MLIILFEQFYLLEELESLFGSSLYTSFMNQNRWGQNSINCKCQLILCYYERTINYVGFAKNYEKVKFYLSIINYLNF